MIEQLFGSKTRARLLYLLFRSPKKSFYVREMAREIGAQLNAVRREIANLEKLGLIGLDKQKKKKDSYEYSAVGSRAKYYSLRSDSLLYPELKSLLLKTQVLKEREMVEQIKKKAGSIKLMLLTGIFTDSSDIATDMLLVGQVKPLVLARTIKSFEKKFGKVIRYTVMTKKEFSERKEVGDKFLYSIFDSKHLVVVNELD